MHNSPENRPSPQARALVKEAVEAAGREHRAPRILFVCLGNICRSPAAQGIAEDLAAKRGLQLECDSAGFYGGHAGDLPDSRMRTAAFARGLRLNHRSRVIKSYDLQHFDIVIGMDARNLADLHRLAATEEEDKKIIGMTDFAVNHPEYDYVPDPYYEGAAGFELVLNLLEDACGELIHELEEG